MSTVPSSPVDERWPVWTDLSDNWRAADAHWLRDRVVNMFDNAAARSTALTGQTLVPGGLSFLQDVPSLEFYKSGDPGLASSWESVRYPNLAVTSDATTVQLRRTGAGSGLILDSSGVANTEKLNAGLGALIVGVAGATLHTGVAGNKTVLLATDATALTIDSPVKIAGALTAPSVALTGALTAATVTATGQVQGATTVATGQASGATVLAGSNALLSMSGGAAALSYSTQTGSGFRANSDGTNTVLGALTTAALTTAAITANGVVTMNAGGKIQSGVDVAGLVVSTVAPTGSDTQPNGTIWIVR